uniref:Uncharacterized protein n=1 Tax=Opuntia streptacantha TaxID=393608 RepID=A0A7C9AC21_OPUST
MKLEHDPGLGVQTPPRKSYNPFDSDEEDTDGYMRSNVNYEIKSFEKSADSLTFQLDSADLSWEEAILAHSQIVDSTIPADANGEEVVYRKDTELFTDKTVTECELPELMVCYKDNAYNSVKDIGVDEGMPTHEKVWIKSRDNQETKDVPAFLDELSLVDKHQRLPFMEGLKSGPENHFEKDASIQESKLDSEALEGQQFDNQHGTNDLKNVIVVKHDLSNEEIGSDQITDDEMKIGDIIYDTEDVQLSQKGEPNKMEKRGNEISEERGVHAVTLDVAEESSAKPSILSSTEINMETNKNQSAEAASSQSPELPASKEPAEKDTAVVLPYNSKVESGSIVLDFNSSAMVPGKEEEEKLPPNEVVANPPEAQSMSRHDDGALASITVSGMDKRVHGETSFSAAMPPPASITYTGPHAHTGSVSLRSESSAGSTRSFAFPVLQAEWNSSPVRMAKADQRHIRKQKGWVHSLMCCRF